jgi:hypothetical protein
VKQTNCPVHGQQGIGLVCTHIAHAVDGGEKVGFYWGDDTDTARQMLGAQNARGH